MPDLACAAAAARTTPLAPIRPAISISTRVIRLLTTPILGSEVPGDFSRVNPLALLCARRQRPRRSAAEKRDEIAAFHSITSSAASNSGYRETERLAGIEIDHQLELGRLHHRQIADLDALEYSSRIDAELTIGVDQVGSIAHEAACLGEVAPMVDRRHAMAHRQQNEILATAGEERRGRH